MSELAIGTMSRADKGPVAPPPLLDEPLKTVADQVAAWSGIITTAHWDLFDSSRVDGIDFYYGDLELGHIHLDGSVHLATNLELGRTLVAEGLCKPFPYQRGWVYESVRRIGAPAAIALFQRNYAQLVKTSLSAAT